MVEPEKVVPDMPQNNHTVTSTRPLTSGHSITEDAASPPHEPSRPPGPFLLFALPDLGA